MLEAAYELLELRWWWGEGNSERFPLNGTDVKGCRLPLSEGDVWIFYGALWILCGLYSFLKSFPPQFLCISSGFSHPASFCWSILAVLDWPIELRLIWPWVNFPLVIVGRMHVLSKFSSSLCSHMPPHCHHPQCFLESPLIWLESHTDTFRHWKIPFNFFHSLSLSNFNTFITLNELGVKSYKISFPISFGIWKC